MTQAAEKLKGKALQLSEADRAELAAQLILSLDRGADDDAEVAWDQELARRQRRMDAGKSKSRPADDVLTEIRNKYE